MCLHISAGDSSFPGPHDAALLQDILRRVPSVKHARQMFSRNLVILRMFSLVSVFPFFRSSSTRLGRIFINSNEKPFLTFRKQFSENAK